MTRRMGLGKPTLSGALVIQSLGLLSSFAGEVSARLGRRVAAGPMPNLRTLKIRNAKTQMPQPTARVTPSTRPGASVDPHPHRAMGPGAPLKMQPPSPCGQKTGPDSPYLGEKHTEADARVTFQFQNFWNRCRPISCGSIWQFRFHFLSIFSAQP